MNCWELTARVEYRINAKDLLVDVSKDWARFALENAAPSLLADQVLGRSIWDFICDSDTRRLYRNLLAKVRSGNSPSTVELCCDAPHLCRDIRLVISPLSRGRVQFVGTVIRAEERDSIGLLDQTVSRSRNQITICSWCKEVLLPNGCFVDVETAVGQLGLFQRSEMPTLRQATCPACLAKYSSIAN